MKKLESHIRNVITERTQKLRGISMIYMAYLHNSLTLTECRWKNLCLLTTKSRPIVSYCRWIFSARSSKSRTIDGFSRDMALLRPDETMAGHVCTMQSQSCRLARHTPLWFPRRQYKAPCGEGGGVGIIITNIEGEPHLTVLKRNCSWWAWGTLWMLGVKPGSAAYKANALSAVLWHSPYTRKTFFFFLVWATPCSAQELLHSELNPEGLE